jgi:cephalosporin-C deacetylase-like acetyl esterase
MAPLAKEWRLFLNVVPTDCLGSFPAELPGFNGSVRARTVSLTDNSLDLARVAGAFRAGACALLYNQFECAATGMVRVGVSADWWLELHVNGEKVYSTFDTGNRSGAFTPSDHVVDFPVKAGRNLVAVKVLSGSGGWRFVCGEPAFHVAEPPRGLDVHADRDNAVYTCGETARFKVRLLDSDGRATGGIRFRCELRGDWGMSVNRELVSGSDGWCDVEATLAKPGFVQCKAIHKPEGAETPLEACAGAAFEPLRITAQRRAPADFDDFWGEARKQLSAIPMRVEMESVGAAACGEVDCFGVRVDCAGGAPVTGYLARPSGARPGTLPAHITFQHGGVFSAQRPVGFALAGFLAVETNAHGIENDKPESFYRELEAGDLKGYMERDSGDPARMYMRGMFLRVLRTLEFLKSRPEWDGRNLVVRGVSQGGTQALVAAGLDPQVSFCVANIPGFCLNTGAVDGQDGFFLYMQRRDGKLVTRDGLPVSQAMIDTVPYYDAAVFAQRIKCPCVLSTGFNDRLCPPTSVYAAFNNIPIQAKCIVNDVEAGHGMSGTALETAETAIKRHLK